MILLINNFTEFYCKKQLDPDKMEIENIFDFKRYVEMAYDCNKPFMQEFVRTQGFTNFIEAAYTELDIVPRLNNRQKEKQILHVSNMASRKF